MTLFWLGCRMNSYIFYGSKSEFEKKIPKSYRSLTDLVVELDVNKMLVQIEGQEHKDEKIQKVKVENFVAESQEYAGVREHVILNFVNFLAKMEVDNLFLHNPPVQISEQIKRLYPNTVIKQQKYKSISEQALVDINNKYDDMVFGQHRVKQQLLKSLVPLIFSTRTKPVVMLFYGSSGVGKTETANFIGDCLKEKIFRKQFSMFQNSQFSTYLFGGSHYEKSFAKDLLGRESNVLLLDEFDKAYEVFHSAFYQLFDEGYFEDQNYAVTLEKSIIICTSNYKDIDEIRKELGDAIYNRFDAVISFAELDDEAKSQIARTCIEATARSYKDEKDFELIEEYSNNLFKAVISCKNAREIQHLVSDTFALAYIQSIKEQI